MSLTIKNDKTCRMAIPVTQECTRVIPFIDKCSGTISIQKVWKRDLITRRLAAVLTCMLILVSGCGGVDEQARVAAPPTDPPERITSLEESPSPATVETGAAVVPPTPTAKSSTPTPTAKPDSSAHISISPATPPEDTASAPTDQGEMTVSEYAEWCGEIEESEASLGGLTSDVTGITWGQLKAWLLDTEESFTSANPPKLLTDYHNYRSSVITVMRGVAEEKDASLLVKPEDMFDPRIMAIALFSPSDEALPSDVRRQLIDSGCISESSADDSGGFTADDAPKEVRRVGMGEDFGGGVEGVVVTVDGFAWEDEIRTSKYGVAEPDEGSKFLVVTFTIRNMGSEDFAPWLVREGFYVEDAAGVQKHGVLIIGIQNVSEERWGVIMADIARAGRTVRTLEKYEISDRASGLVLRSDDFGVFVEVPEGP